MRRCNAESLSRVTRGKQGNLATGTKLGEATTAECPLAANDFDFLRGAATPSLFPAYAQRLRTRLRESSLKGRDTLPPHINITLLWTSDSASLRTRLPNVLKKFA